MMSMKELLDQILESEQLSRDSYEAVRVVLDRMSEQEAMETAAELLISQIMEQLIQGQPEPRPCRDLPWRNFR